MSFANSSLFAAEPPGVYTPFQPLNEVRALFDNGTRVCLALGGWADTAGFSEGAKTLESRVRFAKNIANTLDTLGYDCVGKSLLQHRVGSSLTCFTDIDWEYPGGNGEDYKRTPNSEKASEIETYPRLLEEIKKAIGKKELSIAVPGLERDMIAYTSAQVPKISRAVDFVNVSVEKVTISTSADF
jgi:GH18 family chitinase